MIEIIECDDLNAVARDDNLYYFPFKLADEGKPGYKIDTLPKLNKFAGYSPKDGEYILRASNKLPRDDWGLHKIAKIYHDKVRGYAMVVAHRADTIKNWGELWINSEERAKMRALN